MQENFVILFVLYLFVLLIIMINIIWFTIIIKQYKKDKQEKHFKNLASQYILEND
jgi:preprotein translocase subunit YajC